MNKEYCVFGVNKKSKMSGYYLVPENLVDKIQKGTHFFSEHFNSISEIESLDTPCEVIDTGYEDDVVYYSGNVLDIKGDL